MLKSDKEEGSDKQYIKMTRGGRDEAETERNVYLKITSRDVNEEKKIKLNKTESWFSTLVGEI